MSDIGNGMHEFTDPDGVKLRVLRHGKSGVTISVSPGDEVFAFGPWGEEDKREFIKLVQGDD